MRSVLDIFVLLKDTIMNVIQNSINITGNILNLFYSTCTNEMFVNSRPTSVLEDFIIAFLIEFNRLFIADSLIINKLQEHFIQKTRLHFREKKIEYKITLENFKFSLLNFINPNDFYTEFTAIEIDEKNHPLEYSFSNFF